MLHDEQTLGEVVGQFSADIAKGIVAGVIAQGASLLLKTSVTFFFAAPPAAIILGVFAIVAFVIGNEASTLDERYKFTEPMKKGIEKLIDEN